jgi:hypothetical protein
MTTASPMESVCARALVGNNRKATRLLDDTAVRPEPGAITRAADQRADHVHVLDESERRLGQKGRATSRTSLCCSGLWTG